MHRNLNIPLGPNPLKKLLLFSMIPDIDEGDSNTNFDYEPILDISIYIKLEEYLKVPFLRLKIYRKPSTKTVATRQSKWKFLT